MLTELEARTVHSITQVKMVRLPLQADVGWPESYDGIGIKELYFEHPGIFMGQHAHTIGHTHLVGSGELRAWSEDIELGDFKAGQSFYIEAGKRHILMSLKPDTRGFCITKIALGEDTVVALSECPAQ